MTPDPLTREQFDKAVEIVALKDPNKLATVEQCEAIDSLYKHNEVVCTRLAQLEAKLATMTAERAAITQAISAEFAKKVYTDEDRAHEDLLDNLGVFLDHHNELEQHLAASQQEGGGISMKRGDAVIYKGASLEQIRWGSNDDPRSLLQIGSRYIVQRVGVHSWHTKIELKEHPGKQFNNASFELDPTRGGEDELSV